MISRQQAAVFASAGVVGYVVDAGILQLLVHEAGLQVHFARVLSFLAAVTATWLINRHFTFKGAGAGNGLLREWLKYLASSLVGGAFNYAAFALSIAVSSYVAAHLFLAVAVGSLAGMIVNFLLYSRFVFKPGRSSAP